MNSRSKVSAAVLPLLMTTILSVPALAAQEPEPCGSDVRQRCVAFHEGQVTRLYAAPGATLTVEFPASETLAFVGTSDDSLISKRGGSAKRVSTGADSTGDTNLMTWIPGAPDKPGSFFTLKALHELAPEPLVVLTDWTNPVTNKVEKRMHMFELLTRPGDQTEATPNTYYAVRFTDPAADVAVRRARWFAKKKAEEAEIQAAVVSDRLAISALSATKRNTMYDGQGTDADRAALAPVASAGQPAIYDDGERTFLRYPGNRIPPMIYQVQADGKEAVVGQTTQSDPTSNGKILIVNVVAPMLRLRDGDSVLCIVNRNYDATGRNTGTGTVDPGVVRVTRSASNG